MTGKIYVGVDPGLSGAMAALLPDGSVISWHVPVKTTRKKLPRAKTAAGNAKYETSNRYDFALMHRTINELLRYDLELVVGIERQRGRETDKKVTVLAVGRNQGIWEALFGALEQNYQLVEPSAWKPKYLPPGAPKSESLKLAIKLYPQHDFKINPKTGCCFIKEEARAEALLIADFCRRHDQNLNFVRTRADRPGKPATRPSRKSKAIPSALMKTSRRKNG